MYWRLAHDGSFAVRTEGDDLNRNTEEVLHEGYVVLEFFWQVFFVADSAQVGVPAFELGIDRLDVCEGVDVPFTSLCPCSKEISDYGAHNQRSICRVRVRFAPGHDCILIEDLASLVEAQGSSPIYPLLKRADEKYVTEAAYDNPKFVEDILRDNVLALRKLDGIAWFSVECENFESIHNHNAYASHEENVQ